MSSAPISIGRSADIRELVAASLQHGSSISLILDKPRTLRIYATEHRTEELLVRCKDDHDKTLVMITLPYNEPASAQAFIITTEEG